MQRTIRGNIGILQNTFDIIVQNVRKFAMNDNSANNPPITKAPNKCSFNSKPNTLQCKRLSMQVGISETIRSYSINKTTRFYSSKSSLPGKDQTLVPYDDKFASWLAGLIDGDGYFGLSTLGYASLEIVMEIRDKHCLYQVKEKFGGSIKIKSDVNFLRYRLHHKDGIINIINCVNGYIRNPTRLLQLENICKKYGIQVKEPVELVHNSAWLSGFFDADGSIYFNLLSSQIFITCSQKDRFILESLVKLYGGSIYYMSKSNAYKWTVFRKTEIISLCEYFKLNPCRSAKQRRINLVPNYFLLRSLKAHIASPNSLLTKNWNKFLNKWENYK